MKKKKFKNLELKKRSISNFSKGEIKGGHSTITVLTCVFCPTLTCTQDEVCDFLYSLADENFCNDRAR